MATCRSVITDALLSMKAIAPGDDPVVDELNIGLSSLQQLLLEWHQALGPMTDVDVSADYVAGANQRLRIQAGSTPIITLPNAIPLFISVAPFDYGFFPSTEMPQQGGVGIADGFSWRQPRDGERVEIVGAASQQALYFYVSDLNNWARVYTPDGVGGRLTLALDDTMPVNAGSIGHWGARLAERLIPIWPDIDAAPPGLARRIVMANAALLVRPNVSRDPVAATYF